MPRQKEKKEQEDRLTTKRRNYEVVNLGEKCHNLPTYSITSY